ncbi:MAG: RNase adapter RapZ [Alphaproteobacteria bacterium]|nr:RNase adapter RapZ [Alphaproteobacteria bacterium]
MSDATTAQTTEPGTATGLAGRVVLVTGLSGAGHTSALKVLEDAGCEAVDNLPMRLLGPLVRQGPAQGRGLAIGIDVRTRDFSTAAFTEELAAARAGAAGRVDVVFLDCDEEILRRRYTETRRRHPLAVYRPVTDGIAAERVLLAPLRAAADIVLDTSHTSVRGLARELVERLGAVTAGVPPVFVTSFSYRHGLPRDADLVFDVRFLRNPHYVDTMRPMTGRDAAVGEYIAADPDWPGFFAELTALLDRLLPRFNQEGKSYLTIAVGCTGGRHRSVYAAERLAAWLAARGARAEVNHRELAGDGGTASKGD